MNFEEEFRSFLVLYNNGEIFYFSINQMGEIYCDKFQKIYGNVIPGAHSIEFTENGFNLLDAEGKKIYGLGDYKNTLRSFKLTSLLPEYEPTATERIYFDEDVRSELLEKGKLKYTEASSKIPGLLYDPDKENTYTKKRQK